MDTEDKVINETTSSFVLFFQTNFSEKCYNEINIREKSGSSKQLNDFMEKDRKELIEDDKQFLTNYI